MIGRVVGKYKVLDQIGEGGMGVVYRAEHVVLGSPAAIKVLLPQFTRDELVLDRFFTEAKAASSIRHVGITEVFDFGRIADDQAFIAMELLRGEDLTGFLARHGRLDPSLAAEITMQLLAALNAAHAAGVIHRDLKPDNIFLVRDRTARGGIRVKVLDFGIAKLIGEERGPRPRTKGGAILGTPSYMAPEQCRGGEQIDARADLYAVGCILFELLSGRPPFIAEGDGEIMAMHIYQEPLRIEQLVPSLPAELGSLLARMLAKAPADRTPSAAWALAALERVPLASLDGLEVKLAMRAATPLPHGWSSVSLEGFTFPREQLPRWIPIAVIVIAVMVATAAIYFIGNSGDDFTPGS